MLKTLEEKTIVMFERPALYSYVFKGREAVSDFFGITPEMQDRLTDFNPIFVLGGTTFFVKEKEKRLAEAVKREREIFNALDNGNVVCITFAIDDLFVRTLKRIEIGFWKFEEPRADLLVKRYEFSSFIRRFVAADYAFSGNFHDVLCETKDHHIVGFANKVGKGVLVLIPCHVLFEQFEDEGFLKEFLLTLLDAIKIYIPRIQYEPPNFINAYRFPREALIFSEKEELQKELDRKTKSLERYLKLKEILWFRNHELVSSVMNFFNELGIQTKRDEVYEEDFWILEKDKEAVIVEVKGLDKNLTRPHISKLDEHRGAREKPDDFPALLIVNSFNKANSFSEKDEPIAPNEIKKAVQTNVIVLRTLDLCNAYSFVEEEKLDSEKLLNIIKAEKGWLNITRFGLELKKK